MLDVIGAGLDAAQLEGWRRRVVAARARLGWRETRLPATASGARAGPTAIRPHATGVMLALTAPCDQLFTATEINEWALCATLAQSDAARWSSLEQELTAAARRGAESAAENRPAGAPTPLPVAFAELPPVLEERAALARFAQLSSLEASPRMRALEEAAAARERLCVLDDEALTLGSGAGGRTWPVAGLPAVAEVDWPKLFDVPSALVTGSNGKTTTVRLIAACLRANGRRDGFNCTDGVFVGGEQVASGDYSGPLGTRTILRDPRVEAAVLETARGGILRRGLAAEHVDVSVITNVSADHFGEYGIHDLGGLADVKFVVASAVRRDGLLVLNAGDALLRERAARVPRRIGWFALEHEHPVLRAHRDSGGATSGVRAGRLVVVRHREEIDLGAIAAMPLTVRGSADYNIANVAGAALAALALGVVPSVVASVLSRFGADPADNAGRLMRYDYRGAQVLVDYAHNPDGLGALLRVAQQLKRDGRLALLLGQAGNRTNADIRQLARTAAAFRPDHVVVKETESYLRGRAAGEVPAIIEAELLSAGLSRSAVELCLSELGSVQRLLEWSRAGDVLVLPVHDRHVCAAVTTLLTESR
jgi:UDP-N-acetylmuramyl tripeptide synthase